MTLKLKKISKKNYRKVSRKLKNRSFSGGVKKVPIKLEISDIDLKESSIKYEKIKSPKPVLDVSKIKIKKKQLEAKVKQEPEKKEREKTKEETKKPEEKNTEEFSPPTAFESTRDSSPLIKERKKEEAPVKNMENFLEKLPTSEKKEEKTEEKYSTQRAVQQDYGHGGAHYEKRDEWTDNRDFQESTRRVVLLDEHQGPRAKTIKDQTIEREEFTDTGIAKYEIIKEHKDDSNKYRRRKG